MAGDLTTLPTRTPAKTPASLKKANSTSTGKQQSILGFFARQTPSQSQSAAPSSSEPTAPVSSPCLRESKQSMNELPRLPNPLQKQSSCKTSSATPVLTSDAIYPTSSPFDTDLKMSKAIGSKAVLDSSPTRKVRLIFTSAPSQLPSSVSIFLLTQYNFSNLDPSHNQLCRVLGRR